MVYPFHVGMCETTLTSVGRYSCRRLRSCSSYGLGIEWDDVRIGERRSSFIVRRSDSGGWNAI